MAMSFKDYFTSEDVLETLEFTFYDDLMVGKKKRKQAFLSIKVRIVYERQIMIFSKFFPKIILLDNRSF